MAMLSMMRSRAFNAADAIGNRVLSPPLGGGFRQFVNHGPRTKQSIAFTFDDGPSLGGTEEVLAALNACDALGTFFCVGDNLPYGPQDGVFHSLSRHGEARGLHGAMIEVRNDLLGDEAGQKSWARTLRDAIVAALAASHP